MYIPRKMTDVLPAAGTKTSPNFCDNEFGYIKGMDSSIQTTMAAPAIPKCVVSPQQMHRIFMTRYVHLKKKS
jgi:hypothetical protein